MPQNYILLSKRGHFWLATYVMSGLIWLGKGTSREIEKTKDNMVLLDLNGLSVKKLFGVGCLYIEKN